MDYTVIEIITEAGYRLHIGINYTAIKHLKSGSTQTFSGDGHRQKAVKVEWALQYADDHKRSGISGHVNSNILANEVRRLRDLTTPRKARAVNYFTWGRNGDMPYFSPLPIKAD
jgi:hypothetical protein